MKNLDFLKAVFKCSLSAYGGPEAHYGVFIDVLIKKYKYLTEDELLDLMALTSLLPGPSSTQTIVAIGYKLGGMTLSFLTFLVWVFPGILLMTLFSFFSYSLSRFGLENSMLKYIPSLAIAFMFYGAYTVSKKVIIDKFMLFLTTIGFLSMYFVKNPLFYIIIMIIGGVFSLLYYNKTLILEKFSLSINYKFMYLFLIITVIITFLPIIIPSKITILLSSLYKYGYLVIGGGNVVVPLMFNDFVNVNNYLSSDEFLTGLGFIQGLPGPMFAFSSYVGSLSFTEHSAPLRVFIAILSSIFLFLPGILLIYFVYPIWDKLKNIEYFKIFLKGIIAITNGFIIITPLILIQKNISMYNYLIIILVFIMLYLRKISAPIIVLIIMFFGFFM